METGRPLTVSIRLEAQGALLRLGARDDGWRREAGADIDPGVGWAVRPGLFAFAPASGDPAVIETALTFARRLVHDAPPSAGACALVLPGTVRLDGEGSIESADLSLLPDLDAQPPELEPGTVALTAHAVYELEAPFATVAAGRYRGPSGRELPLFHLGAPTASDPWRNLKVLGRVPSFVERPELVAELRGRPARPGPAAARLVEGPLGAGQTRLGWEARAGEERLWARCWSARSGGPSLAKQFLWLCKQRHTGAHPLIEGLGERLAPVLGCLADWWRESDDSDPIDLNQALLTVLRGAPAGRPLALICDGIEQLGPVDQELLEQLLVLPTLGVSFELYLVGRAGTTWPEFLPTGTRLWVPLLNAEEMAAASSTLLSGLAFPPGARERFIAGAAGNPFALEESILRLVRRRVLRQLYGNFFFSGDDQVQPEPSPRYVRHWEAEATRLEAASALRLLASIEAHLPVGDLTRAASMVAGSTLRRGWHRPLLDAELLVAQTSALGEGLRFRSELDRLAIASTIAPASLEALRRLAGQQLAEIAPRPAEIWAAYQLLRGTPEAIPLLLRIARDEDGLNEPGDLFDALADELEAHRHRGGDERIELQVLWVLLPLARRLGRLSLLSDAMARALDLAAKLDTEKVIALAALKAEQEQNEGRLKDAEASLLQALQRSGDERRKALLIVQLGKVLQRQDRTPEARRLFEDLVPVLDQANQGALSATCRFHLGNIALHEKRLETALQYHLDALKERRKRNLLGQLGASLSARGAIHHALGDNPKALSYYREAQEVLERHGRDGEESYAMIGVGRALSRLGDYTSAAPAFRRALGLREARDDRTGEAIARLLVAENYLHLGQSELALQEARKAHFHLSLTDGGKQLGDAEQILGRIRLRQRRYEDARQLFESAILSHQQHGDVLAATFDRAFLLETSIAVSDHRRIEELCAALDAVLETLRYPELGEMLDLRLYQGTDWLRQRGRSSFNAGRKPRLLRQAPSSANGAYHLLR